MKIDVRYRETTKTPVTTYEIFADGLRIGFVKLDKSGEWRAVNWVHGFIGEHYARRKDATKAVILHYKHFLKSAAYRNVKAFNKHAVRISE